MFVNVVILEKKRTSITRLKQVSNPITEAEQTQTWKEKNLDYEIETKAESTVPILNPSWKEKNLDYEIETLIYLSPPTAVTISFLEKKRTSITRLKHAP